MDWISEIRLGIFAAPAGVSLVGVWASCVLCVGVLQLRGLGLRMGVGELRG